MNCRKRDFDRARDSAAGVPKRMMITVLIRVVPRLRAIA
jgi:hypothetical protein